MARMMITKILMSIVVATVLIELALAENYTVGAPNGGWDLSTNLQSWASSHTFKVGDNLVFSYLLTHSVLEVIKDDYDSCSINPIATYVPSPATVPLTASGSRYFICGADGHCAGGMKVEIKVESSSPPTSTTPSSPTPSDSTPSTPASTTPGTPAPVTKPKPSPSSAETFKMTAVSMVGLGFLMMMM